MSTQTQRYIMLSYQWDHKEVVLKIRDRLEINGYRVWIDDVNMKTGFIYGTMANAVQEAGLVLACLSKKYEKSQNCMSEARCIKEFKTPYIPLKMEDDYKFNDWVAGIFSGDLYVNFSNEATFDDKIQELLRHLHEFPGLNPQVPNPNPLVSLLPPMPATGATSSTSPTANPGIPHPPSVTPNAEQPYRMRGLSKNDFNQLLVEVSSWWNRRGNIGMLKVLLYNFKGTISLTKIEETDDAYDLFELLKGPGLISPSDVEVLVEAIVLGGLTGVEEVLKEKMSTVPAFNKDEIRRFSNHRQKLIKFGKVIGKNRKAIGRWYNLDVNKHKDEWDLILELEDKSIVTENGIKSFIERLKKEEMTREAEALEEK